MTAKRFILTDTDYIYDKQDKGICPTLESVVKLLNELHELAEENENQLSEVMTYLHEAHYEVWEDVYKIIIMKFPKK